MTWPALYFDTETADYSTDDAPALPVQLAAILATEERVVCTLSALIDTRSWERIRSVRIATERSGIAAHGVTNEMAEQWGWASELVLNRLRAMISCAALVVAHNIDFDVRVIDHALSTNKSPPMDWPEQFCTMRESAMICRLPGRGRHDIGGWKPPKLVEAYHYFTKRQMVGNHDALADTYACRQVHRGILQWRASQADKPASQASGESVTEVG